MFASAPDIPTYPATLLTIITAIAPALCAISALLTNVHVPLLITAILPFTAAAFIIVSQASEVSGVPSSTKTILFVKVAGATGKLTCPGLKELSIALNDVFANVPVFEIGDDGKWKDVGVNNNINLRNYDGSGLKKPEEVKTKNAEKKAKKDESPAIGKQRGTFNAATGQIEYR